MNPMGNIMTEPVKKYLDSLYEPLNPFLERLRRESEEQNVPIILRDTERFMVNLLLMKRPRRILEIGTAVGYSSIAFATVCPDAEVISLEISERSCELARKNIRAAGLLHRIRVIQGDAGKTLPELRAKVDANPLERFDFIFIDAAKGHYQEFWNHCRSLWLPGAVVVSDNILFKGITASEEFLTDRRDKTIMRRMREFLNSITQDSDVSTSVLAVGDGMAVSVVKEKGE